MHGIGTTLVPQELLPIMSNGHSQCSDGLLAPKLLNEAPYFLGLKNLVYRRYVSEPVLSFRHITHLYTVVVALPKGLLASNFGGSMWESNPPWTPCDAHHWI